MPTDAELRDYAARLPAIYKDILAAFPDIEPGRKSGYGLAFQTLAMHFTNQRLAYSLGEVEGACRQLEKLGFVEIRNGIFVHPSELGEQLIAVISGKRAPAASLPELPVPTW